MTKKQLIAALKCVMATQDGDAEDWHYAADSLLLEYINDPQVTEAFMNIKKWYA